MNEELLAVIDRAREEFATLLSRRLSAGVLQTDHYVRYLSMQFHLTRGVQRYFITAAAHAELNRRKAFRQFLLDFANEEELHYLVAASDLLKLGFEPLPEPLDVTLWHSYFEKIVERPFIRLGAACILENIAGGVASAYVRQALSAPFLNKDNTKFLVLHQHETVPHGEQILDALDRAKLEHRHIRDLLDGARKGLVMYLRMAEWALDPQTLSSIADTPPVPLDAETRSAIGDFYIDQINS